MARGPDHRRHSGASYGDARTDPLARPARRGAGPAAPAPARPPRRPSPGEPALTKAQAQQVLTSYTRGEPRGAAVQRQGAARRRGRPAAVDGRGRAEAPADRPAASAEAGVHERDLLHPRLTGYPHWFAADAATGEGDRTLRHALLFTQAKAGAPWLLAADPYPTEPALSKIALDPEGYATPVDPGVKDLAIARRSCRRRTPHCSRTARRRPAPPSSPTGRRPARPTRRSSRVSRRSPDAA